MKNLFKRLDKVIDTISQNGLTTNSMYFKYNKLNRKRLSIYLYYKGHVDGISEWTLGREISFVYRGVKFQLED